MSPIMYELIAEMHATIERGKIFNPDRGEFQKVWFEVLPYEEDFCGYDELETENFVILHTADDEWFFFYSGYCLEDDNDEPLIIGWYKHPLRSVWASRDVTISEFRKILTLYKKECKEANL